ncbi:LRR kinase family protein, putative [Medicago truncatula]|uniref:LRR kinase family protein, putative n=1 Tax=Medicago truncatula TaxID=3880 RepID=G7LCA3_MEDTR|nr:LRR kinase family protein, putative [Medicago truncatula]
MGTHSKKQNPLLIKSLRVIHTYNSTISPTLYCFKKRGKHICKNSLTCEIPWSIGNLNYLNKNLQKLTLLDLSYNSLFGFTPLAIGHSTCLTVSLNLSSNAFTEEIRYYSISSHVTSLNIFYNNLSGPIPVTRFFKSLTSSSYLQNLHLCQTITPLMLISGPASRKLNFSINNDILDCLKDKNMIGKGCFGVVYKAEMSHGELLAMKSQMISFCKFFNQ